MFSAALRVTTSLLLAAGMQALEAGLRQAARKGVHSLARGGLQLDQSPVHPAITMLQSMRSKVRKEGEHELEAYQEFASYCRSATGSLEASAAAAEAKVKKLETSIREASVARENLASQLSPAREAFLIKAYEEAKQTSADVQAMLVTQVEAYTKETGELKTDIDALKGGIAYLDGGAIDAFLHSKAASLLPSLAATMELSSNQREMLSDFLSQDDGMTANFAPSVFQTVGILKKMTKTLERNLTAAITGENSTSANAASLIAAKNKVIELLTPVVEVNRTRMQLVMMRQDLKNASESLAYDKLALMSLTKRCAEKDKEWTGRKDTRAEEMQTLAEALNVLSHDEAHSLFEKTLPSPSLLQERTSNRAARQHALDILGRGSKTSDLRLALIALGIRGNSAGLDRVLQMIDSVLVQFGDDQAEDAAKVAYCKESVKKFQEALKSNESFIEAREWEIQQVAKEIESLLANIEGLDKLLAEASEQRKQDLKGFSNSIAREADSLKLIELARNTLNSFYARTEPMTSPAEEKQHVSNPAQALVSRSSGVAIQPASDIVWAPYRKKWDENTGVIAMLDMMAKNVEKDMIGLKQEELHVQSDYDTLIKEAKSQRAVHTKSVDEQESQKVELKFKLMKAKEEIRTKEPMVTNEALEDLHKSCDGLTQSFDDNRRSRASDVKSLNEAKTVLSGVVSFLQLRQAHHQQRESARNLRGPAITHEIISKSSNVGDLKVTPHSGTLRAFLYGFSPFLASIVSASYLPR